jgi:hypothetical protein
MQNCYCAVSLQMNIPGSCLETIRHGAVSDLFVVINGKEDQSKF